jgi:CHAT domain-containing protein
VDERLKREHPEYMQFASPEPLTIAEVQGLLRSNEVLVQFMEAPKVGNLPSELFVWVISKHHSRWASASLDGQSINRMVNSLRCEIDQAQWAGEAAQCQHLLGSNSKIGRVSSTFDVVTAHALYRGLLGPFDDLINGKHLLVVPSGALASLPIHVLVTETSDGSTDDAYREAKWLIARQPISVLPSVASLKALRRAGASKASKPYIGFGNPLLDGSPARTGESDRSVLARYRQTCPPSPTTVRLASMPKFPPFKPLARGGLADIEAIRRLLPLPETADELCTVAASLGAEPTEVRLGSAATEREAKRLSENGQLASYRTIHFATHGALSGEIEGNAEPGLVLTPPTIASEHDDGYLTASEIAALKLDADWVVLSACNTAGPGGANADSLSGVARAFFYAGARSLLVSHWAVDSDATVELVTKTFRALQADGNMTRAEALRRSMLALIERGGAHAHPRMWAPFVVVGEGWASSGQKDVAAGPDGTWIVTVKGETCGVAEVSDKSTYPMTVSGGLITGLNGRLRGKVSSSGVARWTIPAADGSLVRFQGTLLEKTASGRVSQIDGNCEGKFTAKRKVPKSDPLGGLESTSRKKKFTGHNSPTGGR